MNDNVRANGSDLIQPTQLIVAEGLYAPEEAPGPVAVVLAGSRIHAVWPETDSEAAQRRVEELFPQQPVAVMDLRPWRLAPGYLDLHTHGYLGCDITTGAVGDIMAMARALPRTGVTGFLATIATTSRQQTAEQVRRVAEAAERLATLTASEPPAAEILGIRLEGPFISRAKAGAQDTTAIRPPDPDELRKLVAMGRGWVRMLDYAPEEDADGSLVEAALALGLIPAIGHTAATYEQTLLALERGARHTTHLFNAMPPLDHRAPGAAGALLADPRATVELIADGIHVHPALVRIAIAARGVGSVALITDAVSAAGLPDGDYTFAGRAISVRDGAVRLPSGTLAGSTLTLDRAVRNVQTWTGIGWADVIRMATTTPAMIAGVASRKGHITLGYDADLVALDDMGIVRRVWTRGRLAYGGEVVACG